MSSSSLISSINATRSTLNGCIQVGLSSKKRLEISSAATAAVSQIEETLSILPKAKFSPTKKALRAVSNTLQGLANGIDRSELSLADVRNSVRNIRDRLSPTLESGFEDISTIAAEGVAVEQAAQAAAEEESL
jgi:hypothetical protein